MRTYKLHPLDIRQFEDVTIFLPNVISQTIIIHFDLQYVKLIFSVPPLGPFLVFHLTGDFVTDVSKRSMCHECDDILAAFMFDEVFMESEIQTLQLFLKSIAKIPAIIATSVTFEPTTLPSHL